MGDTSSQSCHVMRQAGGSAKSVVFWVKESRLGEGRARNCMMAGRLLDSPPLQPGTSCRMIQVQSVFFFFDSRTPNDSEDKGKAWRVDMKSEAFLGVVVGANDG